MIHAENAPGQSWFQHFEIRTRTSQKDVQKLTDELYNRNANDPEYQMPPEERTVWTTDLKDLFDLHVRSLDPDRRARVLDVGTGTGAFAVFMAEMDFDVTGIDGAKEMIELGTERLKDEDPTVARLVTLKYVHWDEAEVTMAEASKRGGQFDAVVSRHVTTHLYDPIDAFTMWASWLRPGEALIIVDGLWQRSGWSDGFDALIDDLPLSVVSGLGTISYLVEKTNCFKIRYRQLLVRINRDSMQSGMISGPRYVLVAERTSEQRNDGI